MAGKQKSKRKLEDLSVDEFLLSGFDSAGEADSGDDTPIRNGQKSKKKTGQSAAQDKGDDKRKGKASQHKDSLSRLKSKDPEFYKFLQQNDQTLLNFDDTDSSEDEEERKYHTLPKQLEEASSDEEEEQGESTKKSKKTAEVIKVTEKMVDDWQAAIKDEPTPRLFREITQAFKAAVATTKGEGGDPCRYKVADSSVFNALVLFCIRDVYVALQRMLNLKPDKDQKKPVLPSSSPKWQKNQVDIRMYLSGIVQLLSCLTEATVISAVLRHANQLVPYYLCNPKQCRHLLKQLIKQWSTGEETSRVLAFLALNKICRHKQDTYLNPILKVCPLRLSVPSSGEVRPLSVLMLNETYQSVYNWQFVHCLYLWCRVLSTLHPSDVLQPLIYPLCQVIVGTIKLVPTSRYYPLRIHCVRALTLLSGSTHTFVPVLPFLLEVRALTPCQRCSSPPRAIPSWAYIYKASSNQQDDGLIEQVYDLILEYFHSQACSIGFPELALPTIIQLKAFLKECKVANYCKQIRQLLEKVQENSGHITARRQRAAFGVADATAVAKWEKQTVEEGTPLTRYYSQWKKLREKEIQLEISGKERMEDLDLPEIKRRKIQEKKAVDKKEFKDLFESDSDSDDDGGLKVKDKRGGSDEDDDDDADLLQELSDLSDDEGVGEEHNGASDDDCGGGDDDEEEGAKASKAPKQLSSVALKELAEGDEDLVEDLELSDQD
uniref:NOC2-like nucleolar associated transcriptional repressor n=1 Tax=Hucho hucho TaxID=62062 RepID=A0A4W5NMI5_9TELE